RDGRQISGAGSARSDLFDDDVFAGRSAAWNGILVQPEPAKCSNVAGDDGSHRGGESAAVRAGVPQSAADAARKRFVQVPGDGYHPRSLLNLSETSSIQQMRSAV